MRKDFNKLLCERERYGSDQSFRQVRQNKKFNNFEEGPTRESMKKRHKVTMKEKSFGENLRPLYRFIEKNVGRKWDAVYSELCSTFDMRSVINQHILVHLWFWVDAGNKTASRWSMGSEFLVNDSGILVRNPEWVSWRTKAKESAKKRAEEEFKIRRIIDENTELRRRKDGVWFVCTMAKTPKTRTYSCLVRGREEIRTTESTAYCAWEGDTVGYYNHKTYVVSKRTANKKELKKHGIK